MHAPPGRDHMVVLRSAERGRYEPFVAPARMRSAVRVLSIPCATRGVRLSCRVP